MQRLLKRKDIQAFSMLPNIVTPELTPALAEYFSTNNTQI
jgi:hypothetical protein